LWITTLDQKIIVLSIRGGTSNEEDILSIAPTNGITIETGEDGLFEEVLEVEELESEAMERNNTAFDADFARELEQEENGAGRPSFEPHNTGWGGKSPNSEKKCETGWDPKPDGDAGWGGTKSPEPTADSAAGWDAPKTPENTGGGWGAATKSPEGGGWDATEKSPEKSGGDGWDTKSPEKKDEGKAGWGTEPEKGDGGGWGAPSPTPAEPRSPEQSSAWGEAGDTWVAPPPAAPAASSGNENSLAVSSGGNKFEKFATGGDDSGKRCENRLHLILTPLDP